MSPELQTFISVSVPTLGILIGILVNNSRLSDMNGRIGDMNTCLNDMNTRLNDMNVRIGEMRTHFDGRLDDIKETWRAELRRVEEILDARLSHLENRR